MAIRCGEVAAGYKQEAKYKKDEDYDKSEVRGNDRDQKSENKHGPHCSKMSHQQAFL